ncbi:class I SAM-dependent methyltransferase [Marinobacter sp. BW6]|uniref:class I SAM-dependent methyltransferase n=1 Tax=Marinobacter sp. BW6 TaxID=2592624 RepID=UPI0011DEECCA|nr:class I SAM-dependent methyltransferase [Marinobacter sp. BW6]TYC58159.1 class I SAM-dependent methyltransferase [Marinobacter sp. BW6]
MSLPNSHEVLLRNRHLLKGRMALLGVTANGLLADLPAGGMAMSEHAGVCAALAGQDSWQICFGYDDPALEPGTFDTLVVFLPKARAELDLRLALARWLAVPGAQVVLVGEKKEGIAGAVKQLKAVAPQATKTDSARHCQVWCAEHIEPLPEFSLQQWITWTGIDCKSVHLDVAGLPGIFSLGELDEGTRLLLETLDENPLRSGSVLDFACGAGVLGTWLHRWHEQQNQPRRTVDGIDVQSQAVICARATYERNGVSGRILASDGLSEVEGTWPVILSNPPFHSGVRTDLSMTERFLREVVRHLAPGGEVRLVANSFLPYEPLMKRCIGPVERLREDRRFTVYRAFRHS